MCIKRILDEWYYLLRRNGNGLARVLRPEDINNGNITEAIRNRATNVIRIIDGIPRKERFDILKAHRSELEKIGLYYSAVPKSGHLRLDKLNFPDEWGEEVARNALNKRRAGDRVGSGKQLLDRTDKRLNAIIEFCSNKDIDLNMDGFISSFKSTADSSRGLRVAPLTTNIPAAAHPFLDREYRIQNTVVSFSSSESKLENLLASNDNFKTRINEFHHGFDADKSTIVVANNGATSLSAYTNFDLYSITKTRILGKVELRTSVFELKKDNSTASIYKAMTQAISYRSKKIANYVWIVAPGFNEEQFAGSDFASIRNQCMHHGIGILDIVLSGEADIDNIIKRLDAKKQDIEDSRIANRILEDAEWKYCPMCHDYSKRQNGSRYCEQCRKEIAAIIEVAMPETGRRRG